MKNSKAKKKVVKRVADKAQDEKMRRTITETDDGHNFFFTKFSVIDFFLTERRNIFMYMATIGLWQIFELSIVALSREKYHYPGQVRNFRFQFSYFSFLPSLRYFERHCLLQIRFFFFALLAAIIRENIDEPPWIETGQRFAIHLLTWHSWLAISNT